MEGRRLQGLLPPLESHYDLRVTERVLSVFGEDLGLLHDIRG